MSLLDFFEDTLPQPLSGGVIDVSRPDLLLLWLGSDLQVL